MTSTREKVSAIFLAAIMVISMAAMGAAGFAGSAVAQEAGNGEAILFDGDEQIETFDGDRPIQNAINAIDGEAEPRVEVGPGTYDESVTIDVEGLTLEGPNDGIDGDSDARGSEALINNTNADTGGAISIVSPSVTVDGFQIESDAQDGISVSEPVDAVTLQNNRITSVEGLGTFSSGGGDRATGNGIAFGLPRDTSQTTVTGAVIKDNVIAGVSTTDLSESEDRTTANGIQVLTRQHTVEGMEITGNVITELEAGTSGDSGDKRARGIVVNVGSDGGTIGAADGFTIANNDISEVTGAGGFSDATGLGLFEAGGAAAADGQPRIGPENFTVIDNQFDDLTNNGKDPAPAIFVGGIQTLGESHSVTQNQVDDGSIVRFAGEQPGFDPATADALNADGNTFTDASADLYYADATDAADLDAVFGDNDFSQVNVVVGDTAITRPRTSGEVLNVDQGTSFDSIQNAVESATAGNTISVGSGTFNESVEINTDDITLEGPNAGIRATDTNDRGSEAIINSTSQSPAVVINGSRTVLNGFEIRSDGQDGIRLSNSTIDDITIINNRITDVDGSAYIRNDNPSGAGNGIQIQFAEDGSVDNTVDNVSISRNLISGVTTADTQGRTLAIGINVLPRGNNVTRLNITENTITALEPGDSGSEEEARGISIDTQVTEANSGTFEGDTDDSKGVVAGPVVADNNIRDFSGNADSAFEVAGITFFGDNADKTDIGVKNFRITSNNIENITNDGGPSSTVLIGGEYSNLGDEHRVTNNTLVGGAVIRFSTSTPNTDDTLNATSNWWGSANGPAADTNTYNDTSQGAAVSSRVEFTPWLTASTDNDGQPFAPVTNSSEGQFASIQAAVFAAGTDDTIAVESGTYNESVSIDMENVTLEGPNAGVAGDDDARGSEAIITGGSTDTPGVRVIADEVTVDGLQIENPGQDGVRFGSDTVPSNVTIQNNVITNIAGSEFAETQSAANGIQFQFASGNPNGQTASNIRILDNEISNVSAPSNSGELTATGVNVLPRGNDIDGFEIDGNTISNIKPGSGNPGEARGIIIDTQKDDPDRKSASAGAAGAVSGLSITDNEFTNLAGDDVNVISLFEDSRINPRIGPENFKIVNNDISNLDGTNDEFAVFIGGYETLGADHEVSQNNFRDGAIVRFSESQSGFDSSAADTLNATSNWWGASSGPSGQGPGSGSAVSANVTFEPFYIDAAKQTLRVDVNDESVENASRTNVGGDGSATVTVGGRDVQSTTVTLPSGSSATSVTVGEASAPTGSAQGSEPENDVATYLNVSADSEVDDSVDISVTVEKSTLSDAGIATEDAVILHYVDGAWTELETTPSTGGGTVTLTATATGLSPFAVGAAAADPAGGGGDTGGVDDGDDGTNGGSAGGGGGGVAAPEFAVSDLTPQTATVEQGETVTVTATVDSDSLLEETQDVELRIGNETVATQSATIALDERRTIEFNNISVDLAAGEYTFGVYTDDDGATGTITVPSQETEQPPTETEPTEPATGDSNQTTETEPTEPATGDSNQTATDSQAEDDGQTEDGIPGFGPLVGIVALLIIALLAVAVSRARSRN